MADKEYFDLALDELRCVAEWAARCAERALTIFETVEPGDPRPRRAIEGAVTFARGGPRTQALRRLAMDAYRASLAAETPAAAAAARAASLAAAAAFTHPFRDLRQAEHILGSAAYSALSVELARGGESGGESDTGERELDAALEEVDPAIAALLAKMPERGRGKTRVAILLDYLDRRIRGQTPSALP